MEMERSKACSRCRQRFMAKSSSQGAGVECLSCRSDNVLVPSKNQGLRSRIRSLSSEIRSKMHQRMVVTPSLNLQPSASFPTTMRSNKRAVLCGITYNNWKELRVKGSINDVKNMRELLITKFGYPNEWIRSLTEEELDRRFIPTRKNMEDWLRWLVKDCRPGDSLLFYFSGHGSRVRDYNDDEVDGFDETICPLDFNEAGMMVDNDLNSLIVRPLPHGVTLHAIVDACHSGTILDLTKVYNSRYPPSGVYKGTNGGLAICISACVDNQAAADTYAFTPGTKNGALTYVLVEILKQFPSPTYGDIFDLIHEALDNVNQSRPRSITGILKNLVGNKLHLSQTPILSSSVEFDVYRKHFIL
ncbi:Detected protein of confused Function [Hibiscus syriacus]|uniref:Detected protein of confused Function n=1 Tax=Hibiscus syriacus TaxID=106335 RepID=A0A6A2XMT2_HIBSY|nr:Detected protein of confused Function [Hibiscus syriacus]